MKKETANKAAERRFLKRQLTIVHSGELGGVGLSEGSHNRRIINTQELICRDHHANAIRLSLGTLLVHKRIYRIISGRLL